MARKIETMTTPGGNPIADNQNSVVQRPRSGAVKSKSVGAGS